MLTRSLAKSPIFCLIGCSLAHPGLYFYNYLLACSLNLDLLTLLTCSLTSQMNNTLKQVFMLTPSLAKPPICCLIGCSLAHLGIYFYNYLLARSLNLDLLTLLTCSLTSQMNNTLKQVFTLTRSLAKSPICCLIGCSFAHLGIYFYNLLTCSVKLMLIILCSLAHSG